VDLTSLTDLAVYQVLAIPEVWIYRQGQLMIYGLTATGYDRLDISPTFPTYAQLALLVACLEPTFRRLTIFFTVHTTPPRPPRELAQHAKIKSCIPSFLPPLTKTHG
jgi:hypothetical protein